MASRVDIRQLRAWPEIPAYAGMSGSRGYKLRHPLVIG